MNTYGGLTHNSTLCFSSLVKDVHIRFKLSHVSSTWFVLSMLHFQLHPRNRRRPSLLLLPSTLVLVIMHRQKRRRRIRNNIKKRWLFDARCAKRNLKPRPTLLRSMCYVSGHSAWRGTLLLVIWNIFSDDGNARAQWRSGVRTGCTHSVI